RDRNLPLPGPALCRTTRVHRKSKHADVAGGKFAHIADRAVDHDSGPAIARRRTAEIAAQYGATLRPASINHEDPPRTRSSHDFSEQRVVFEKLQRGRLSGELGTHAERPQARCKDLDLTRRERRFVRVAEVGARKFDHVLALAALRAIRTPCPTR